MTVPQCCPQGFQSCDVTREFENSQYSEDPEDLSSFSNVFNAVSRVEQGQDKRHVEGEDPQEVNYIEEGNNEEKLQGLSGYQGVSKYILIMISAFCGATTYLTRYSRVNQPTNIPSATRKKRSSSSLLSVLTC